MIDVSDGDTIRVQKASGEVLRVRLIGIDAPETVKPGAPGQCGGPEATSNMLALTFPAPADTDGDGLFDQEGASEGAMVRLKTDRTQHVYDRYGRALAYVNVLSNGQHDRPPGYDVGLDQIRSGWATTYVFGEEFGRFNSYLEGETVAEEASGGVYGKCGGDFHASRS